MTDHFADILVAAPIGTTLRYRATKPLKAGQLVVVPLGRRHTLGVVWYEAKGKIPTNVTLKSIHHVFDTHPCLPTEWMTFLAHVAAYYIVPLGWVVKTALPLSLDQLTSKSERVLVPAKSPIDPDEPRLKRSPKLRHFLEELPLHLLHSDREWRAKGFSTNILNRAVTYKFANWQKQHTALWQPQPLNIGHSPITHNNEQAAGYKILQEALNAEKFATLVLDGVTGSGKTEVYLEAIAHCILSGRQVLVMMPEIGLTADWFARCQKRFGADPVLWHSQLSGTQRKNHWLAVLHNTASLVVGARSALFLPFKQLGLIIVDEEHDPSYKSHDGLPYQARDMAVLRSHLNKSVCTLVSATPSLESVLNMNRSRYQHIVLSHRYSGVSLPKITLVDKTSLVTSNQDAKQKEDTKGPLTPQLEAAITESLSQEQQILLYLNRRGYAPVTLCKECGKRLLCPHCDQHLICHKQHNRWICHVCGYEHIRLDQCLYCMKYDSLVDVGIGAEKLFEIVQKRWPSARSRLITSDHIRGMDEFKKLIDDVTNNRIDILIGTQILAKGYHFPRLQLVGIIDGDGANAADFRMMERQFQLLQQVAGRAGRSEDQGKVIIQCFNPQTPVLESIERQDRAAFVKQELRSRNFFGWPPYSRLMAINITGNQLQNVREAAQEMRNCAPADNAFRLLGPAPALVPRIRSTWRYRLLLSRSPGQANTISIQDYWHRWHRLFSTPSNIKVRLDVDPYHFD